MGRKPEAPVTPEAGREVQEPCEGMRTPSPPDGGSALAFEEAYLRFVPREVKK
jgi:hypothetical protein